MSSESTIHETGKTGLPLLLGFAWAGWISVTLVVEVIFPENRMAWTVAIAAFVVLTAIVTWSGTKDGHLIDLLSTFLQAERARGAIVLGWLGCLILRLLPFDSTSDATGVSLARLVLVVGLAVWLVMHFLHRKENMEPYSSWFRSLWTAWAIGICIIEFAWPHEPYAWLAVLISFIVIEGAGVRRSGPDTWSELVWVFLGKDSSHGFVAVAWVVWISLRLLLVEGNVAGPHVDHPSVLVEPLHLVARTFFLVAVMGSVVFHPWRRSSERSDP